MRFLRLGWKRQEEVGAQGLGATKELEGWVYNQVARKWYPSPQRPTSYVIIQGGSDIGPEDIWLGVNRPFAPPPKQKQ